MAELNVRDTLEAMIAGTHVPTEVEGDESVNEDTGAPEEEVDPATAEEEIGDDYEDTELPADDDVEDETEETDDDLPQETSETTDEAQEENSHEKTTNTDDTAEESEHTEESEVDYKAFYEKVALAKFTANGREVEGFKDPEDLIRAQQMLHGYSDKMKVFKEYKKFLKPLEERGITQDPDKFNLAMNLLDGDVNAIKKVLKDKNIDPLELDLEDIQYTPKNVLPTQTQLLIEDTYEQANSLGIGDKFNTVVTKDWDVKSLQELIDNRAVRNDLLQHLSDGTYEIVQDEIRRMELIDSTNSLEYVPVVEKYRMAVARLQQKHMAETKRVTDTAKQQESAKKVEEEKARIQKEREAEEFKRKAAAKEKEVAAQRNKAASVSKPKAVKKPTEEVKPEALKGDAFRDYFKQMLMR